MKFLVLGCNGMAGHMISLYLKEQGYEVDGFARKESPFIHTILGDARNPDNIRNLIRTNHYDTIVNCIGLLNKICDERKSDAVYLNAFFPHYLAELTKETDTQVIQMSTDCVFSGNRGEYCEYDLRDGTAFYDRTKALGELEDNKNATIRSSIVGPDLNPEGIGLLNWFMKQNDKISGYTQVFWTGQTTLQYAKTIEAVAKERVRGIIHLVPDRSISKYDLLCFFNQYFRKGKINIIPLDSPILNKSLKRTRFDFEYRVPDYEQMIMELDVWMRVHKDIYPHYQKEMEGIL